MPSPKKGRTLTDFREVLLQIADRGDDSPVLVGGQAVVVHAERFHGADPEMDQLPPCLTADLDILGSRALVKKIGAATGQPFYVADPFGKAHTTLCGTILLPTAPVHVMFALRNHKISPRQIRESAILARHGDITYRVIHPLLLLREKVHLTLTVDQSDRNDLLHSKILLVCVRAFAAELIRDAGADPKQGRACVNFVHEIVYFARSRDAVRASRQFGTDWERILPLDAIRASSNPKIVAFCEKELHRVKLSHQ